MLFMDPLDVKCDNCAHTSAYPVDNLMRLEATCLTCGRPLDETGLSMRQARDDNFALIGPVELLMEIEEKFIDEMTAEFSDEDMDSIKTVNDVILLTKSRTNQDIDHITKIVLDLIEDIAEQKEQNIKMDSTLAELFKHDWDKRYGIKKHTPT